VCGVCIGGSEQQDLYMFVLNARNKNGHLGISMSVPQNFITRSNKLTNVNLQAVEYVSGCISRGDFAALENMVTQDALEEVKRNMSTFTLHQRQELALSKEDIYFCFPYQIGVMFSDDDSKFVRVRLN
jgi:hypothetical protein